MDSKCYQCSNWKKYGLLIFVLYAFFDAAAQTVINGTVINNEETALPSVSVSVKGFAAGTITDNNGRYTLSVKPAYKVLVFSSLGYISREVSINGQKTINIRLETDASNMNEVIVTGYTSTLRKDLTGSVGSVSMRELQKAPVASFDQALAGRVAGVQVTSQSGRPGAGIDIVIRGASSITQSTAPLYVIDGFPMEDPDNNILDPQNIESIDILKDASATALYGAKGSNGVIVITTKRGAKGQPHVSYNFNYGWNRITKYMKLLTPYQFVQLASEMAAANVAPNHFLSNGKVLEDYRNVKGIDWQDQLFRVAGQQNHSISLTGGTGGTRYSFSGNYFKQDGIMIASSFRRYQGKLSLDQTVGKKFRVGGSVMYTNTLVEGTDPQQNGSNSLFNSIFTYPPISFSTSTDSLLLLDFAPDGAGEDTEFGYRFNPLSNLKNLVRNTITDNIISNLYIDYNISKRLKLTVRGSANNRFLRQEQFNNSRTYAGTPTGPNINGINGLVYNHRYDNFGNANLLTYTNTFNKRHYLTVTVASDIQKSIYRAFGYQGVLLPTDVMGISGIDAGDVRIPPLATVSYSTLASGIASLAYNFRGRYYFTGNFRADGSSKFIGENRWGYFPSTAVKWKFTNEKFISKNDILTDGNIRLSYGETGNNRVSDFATYAQIGFNSPLMINGTEQPSSAVISTSLPNPILKWETTRQTDLGFDLGFWKNLITLTVDLYNRQTDNLLYLTSLPGSTGYATAIQNIASLSNRGLEFTLKANLVQQKNFSYSTNLNISFNRNRLNKLSDPTQDGLFTNVGWDGTYGSIPAYLAQIGGPLGQMYGFVSDGLYQYRDFDRLPNGTLVLKPGVPRYSTQLSSDPLRPGASKYVDINSDGVLDNLDRVVIGNGYPKSTGGWSNNFTYRNFDINIFLQYSYGNSIINANRMWFGQGMNIKARPIVPYQNAFAELANRWTPTNQDTDIPTIRLPSGPTGPGAPYAYSSQFVEDGSYLRIKTVNIGYNLPGKLLLRYKIKALRLYASAQNIYTWTKYKGYDPEVSAYQSVLSPGLDYSSYPRPFTVTAGLNLSL